MGFYVLPGTDETLHGVQDCMNHPGTGGILK